MKNFVPDPATAEIVALKITFAQKDAALSEARAALRKLDSLLSAPFAGDGPTLSAARDVLAKYRENP